MGREEEQTETAVDRHRGEKNRQTEGESYREKDTDRAGGRNNRQTDGDRVRQRQGVRG